MPHLIVKMYAGRDDADKQTLADRLTSVITETLGYEPAAISIAIQDVAPANWMAEVYQPDIAGRRDQLFKRPGYGPLRDRDESGS